MEHPRIQIEADRALWTLLATPASAGTPKAGSPDALSPRRRLNSFWAACAPAPQSTAVLPGAQRVPLCSSLCPWPLVLVLSITEKKQRHERWLPALPKHKPEESVPGKRFVIPHRVRQTVFDTRSDCPKQFLTLEGAKVQMQPGPGCDVLNMLPTSAVSLFLPGMPHPVPMFSPATTTVAARPGAEPFVLVALGYVYCTLIFNSMLPSARWPAASTAAAGLGKFAIMCLGILVESKFHLLQWRWI